MNAYELALQLEDFKCVYQGAEMLRQQADRIEELEKRLCQYECHHGVEGGHACKECYEELTIKASMGEE